MRVASDRKSSKGGQDRFGPVRYSDLERIIEYLKRSLKIAWKSIFFNFKQYIFFFIAILIVQMFYGVMTISTYNNTLVEREFVKEYYDYHVLVTNINEGQLNLLSGYGGSVSTDDQFYGKLVPYSSQASDSTNNDASYLKKVKQAESKYVEYKNSNGDKRFDVYIVFKSESATGKSISLSDSFNKLDKNYLNNTNFTNATEKNDQFFVYKSPLMNVSTNILANNAVYYTISAVLLALSIFLMMMLYNIRVNQYKFTYGVYMTFGADFKMLFNTAFWEMFVIMVLTFIPSVIFSTLIVFIMYIPSGFGFTFSAMVFLKVFVFSLIVVTVAVFFPMRVMAVRMPMTLIVTQDNSNLVSSPKNSVNIFKRKFPTFYETLSSWRFRKYSANLLLTAIVFCAIFIMGLYLADIYRTDLEYNRAEYTVDLSAGAIDYDDVMSEELYSVNGVKAVEAAGNYVEATKASSGPSHILVPASKVKALRGGLITYDGKDYKGEGSMKATNSVLYNGVTAEQLKVIEQLYAYDGNLQNVLKEGYVIIGDSLSNMKTFKYKVGDTIEVAIPVNTSGAIDDKLSGKQLLRAQIEKYKYQYKTFTIAAILTDIPSKELPIYFNTDDYAAVTGAEFSALKLNIYVDPDMSPADVAETEKALRVWAQDYDSVGIESSYNLTTKNIAYDKHRSELYITISIMLLVISPIMWFFSQTLYYLKRESEFNILQALGARVRDIRNIYVQGGLQMAGLSLIVSVALSFLGSYILFYVYNVIIPNFFTPQGAVAVRYTFYMPWYAILTSVLVSVACGFLSAYLPYKSYYKNRFTLENGGAGSIEE